MTTETVPAFGGPEPVAPVTRHVQVVANPTAGGFRFQTLDRLVARLDDLGVRTDVRLTRQAGELVEIARGLSPAVDTLVVGGGDGSINEAVRGLVDRAGAPPALAILPFGTANVLAAELSLPFAATRIADSIVARQLAPLYLGRIGDRPFLLMASAGFDASVVHGVDPKLKRRIGKLAYVAAIFRLAFRRDRPDVIVTADGETFTCRIAVATTARCYGGPLTLTPHTGVTVPGLRLVTVADDRPLALLKAGVMLGLGRLARLSGVTDRAVVKVRFGGADVEMQVDGDPIAPTNSSIEAHPRVLSIITA